jgi:hypothetical protein
VCIIADVPDLVSVPMQVKRQFTVKRTQPAVPPHGPHSDVDQQQQPTLMQMRMPQHHVQGN